MTFLWVTVIPPKSMACVLRREDGPAGQDPVGVGAFIATSRGGYAVKIVGDMEISRRMITKKVRRSQWGAGCLHQGAWESAS